ncbi:thioredoxin-like domain-containing protein [Caenispirillum bisanense]|uniref:Thiol-disulfide isomerase or thioredoxin n=1 Tax=Caenispirillum bisanense TaxID=414052 RepID=A0A286G4S1_9PROT|nr:thioredoxin-like domain-containing protein [Caenispirillum bisanense]SOD89974.1 Thiol-disulfide isomerase or thioredoxin [Caenispirillum bisanense]
MYGLVRAPEIGREGLTWFNVPEPLSLKDLRGRIVVLDFWTYCCINCVQVLPTLRRLEETYPREVAVIGVHSPKFAAERDPAAVAHAIKRYDIRHPVVHDPYMTLWDEYAVRAWPTLVLIGPDGKVIGQMSGEPDPDLLVQGIGDLIANLGGVCALMPGDLPLTLEEPVRGPLAFPGKVKPLPGPEKRWAVADGGHHRIVVCETDGRVVARYGTGLPGMDDGPAEAASFTSPQGLACTADAIFVADTGNHLVRRIDLHTGLVSTVAGLGFRGMPVCEGGPADRTPLASPWDLEIAGDTLFVANAGTHQLLTIDLAGGHMASLAGTGGENIHDGPARRALLAQPSGLALAPDGSALYFADSETSALRKVMLTGAQPEVRTLVGRGLFDFGLADGHLSEARMQHPLGVAVMPDGRIAVADSYNHAIRLVDEAAGTVETVRLGTLRCEGSACRRPLSEPAGLWAKGPDSLLVADTNNHRVVEVDLSARRLRPWLG